MFRKVLARGKIGAQLEFPPTFILVDEAAMAVTLADREGGILWRAFAAPWLLDLSPAHRTLAAQQSARAARAAFDQHHAATAGDRAAPMSPRTADPAWSPIIERRDLSVSGAPAVATLLRLEYRPGAEHVVARLQVPLEDWTLEIEAHAIDTNTGLRETVLHLASGTDGFLSQEAMDDPAYDAQLSELALARARRAMGWICSAGAGLRITRPRPPAAPGEVYLELASSALTPPPRYLALRPEALRMSPTLESLSRVTGSAAELPDMIDVWRLPERLAPADGPGLEALGRRVAHDFEREGAGGVQVATLDHRPLGGRTAVTLRVEFTVDGQQTRSVHRYLIDHDGQVFRIAVSAKSHVPWEEVAAEVELAAESWRKVDPPAKRRWWPFGSRS